MPDPVISVKIGDLQMKNPVMTASGCYGYGEEYQDIVPLEAWGAVVVKGTTCAPREGNPPPRLVETPSGLINSVGLHNPGIETVIERELPRLGEKGVPVVVNLAGESEEEYIYLARRLEERAEVEAVELNISCPNVKKGGIAFGSDAVSAGKLVAKVRENFSRTLLVKLTPNVGNLPEIAGAVEKAGADALSLINTLRAMVIDIHAQKPVLPAGTGGLSGPAIKPVALRAVWEVTASVNVPVVGMGGIFTPEDAIEFILAGANAVAVGSAIFVNPRIPAEIVEGINSYMKQKGYENIGEMVGAARQ